MISFLDRSFCGTPECTNKCGRKLTEELVKQAIKWWGRADFPVSMGDYCDSKGESL